MLWERPPVKLSELRPRWFAEPGRLGQGVVFQCPCCIGKPRAAELAVAFANPLDGGAPFPISNQAVLWEALVFNLGDETHPPIVPPGVLWHRTGETFEALSFNPSVDTSPAGHWHGFVLGGNVR